MKIVLSFLLLWMTAFAESQQQSDVPTLQQFCSSRGWDCFAIDQIDVNEVAGTLTLGSRAPIPISQVETMPITALGETGTEYEFTTLWGSGLLVDMPSHGGFSGKIDLDNDMEMYIFPCANREECTSFGYELHTEYDVPEVPEDYNDEEDELHTEDVPEAPEDTVSRRLRRLLQSFTESSPSPTPRPNSVSVETLRRDLGDSNCKWTGMYGNECTATFRMVFQEGGPNPWSPIYPDRWFAYFTALKLVAEFNSALRKNVDTEHVRYRLKLEGVDFSSFSHAKIDTGRGCDVCWAYAKAQQQNADITQCVIHDTQLMTKSSGPKGGFGGGNGGSPWGRHRGLSWIQWREMLMLSYGGAAHHEIGHNFGGEHEWAYGLDKHLGSHGTIMTIPPTYRRQVSMGFSDKNAAIFRWWFPRIGASRSCEQGYYLGSWRYRFCD